MLISDHVESITKVVWDELPLLICSSLGVVGVALFALLSLFVGFTVDSWLIIADVEDHVSSSRWNDREAGKTRGRAASDCIAVD